MGTIMINSHKLITLFLLLALVSCSVNARITNCNMVCNGRNRMVFPDPGYCDNGATGKVLLWDSAQTRSYACEKCKYPSLKRVGPPTCFSWLKLRKVCC